jgi:hypothetical protein
VATAADFALHHLVTVVQLLCLLQLIIRLLQLIRVEQALPLGGRPGFPLFHSLTFLPSKNTFIDPNYLPQPLTMTIFLF